MQDTETTRRPGGIAGALDWLIRGWALMGGLTLLAVVLVNVISVIGAIVWQPFPGDFELTEMGVAVAAFAFLPYCQLTGANVTADIFTANASKRWLAVFRTAASIVAALFAAILLWRMQAGMMDQKNYNYTTAILQVPIWWAYVPVLISLGLLVVASVMTLISAMRAVFTGQAKA
jgi:TRAP-type C4-dicarboxylate transport system permease small subunit